MSDKDGEKIKKEKNWSPINWLVIIFFSILTLVGIILSVGLFESVVAITQENKNSNLVTVPLYIYLYSGFGALGYIFTKLMTNLDQYDEWGELEELVEMSMRIPAAWILATGIYLFLGEYGQMMGSTTGEYFTAGTAFLVGLYINITLKGLGSLADRILGRSPQTRE